MGYWLPPAPASGKKTKLAATLLGVELLLFVAAIYLPGIMGAADEQSKTQSMVQMLKDTMLAGGAFALAALAIAAQTDSN